MRAKVVRIVDGDTSVVRFEGDDTDTKIRHAQYDAPEHTQPFGTESTAELTGLMPPGSTVDIDKWGKDRYGRTIGDVHLLDGRSVAQIMVQGGYARVYRQYRHDKSLEAVEDTAHANKVGMWAQPQEDPAAWRRMLRCNGKGCQKDALAARISADSNEILGVYCSEICYLST